MPTNLATAHHAPATASKMRAAAMRFLDSLDARQRESATFDLGNDERYEWSFLPDRKIPLSTGGDSDGGGVPLVKPLPGELPVRSGLPLRDMTHRSRTRLCN